MPTDNESSYDNGRRSGPRRYGNRSKNTTDTRGSTATIISMSSPCDHFESQDVRNSPQVFASRDNRHNSFKERREYNGDSKFPPALDLSRDRSGRSKSGTPGGFRTHWQSPGTPSPSPKYSTPLDKSVIWKLCEAAPAEGKLMYINEQLQRHGLHTIPDHKGCRILINGKTLERDSGYTQFVGSILSIEDTSGISLLSTMPPVTTVNARTLLRVEKHWDDLELLQAEDGATLGLYWYRDQWVIRTAGSFDAGQITWDGKVTFGQMVDDIMKKYPQFRYDVLDKSKCYTFGIKHPAIHAYREGLEHPIMRAWFIQSANISLVNSQFGIFNGSIQFDEPIGLPMQRSLSAATFISMRAVPFSIQPQYIGESQDDGISRMHVNGNSHARDDDYKKSGISLGMILEHTRGALGSAIASAGYADSSTACANGYYGVILRSKKYTFFIPSDLYQYIASTHYTNELNDMLGDEQFHRDKYITLFNALCPLEERKMFMCIYPQYASIIIKIRDYLINEFVSAMYAVFNNYNTGTPIGNVYDESTLDLARSIFTVWVRQNGAPKSCERSKIIGLFVDYVLDKRNARVLYHNVYSNLAEDVE